MGSDLISKESLQDLHLWYRNPPRSLSLCQWDVDKKLQTGTESDGERASLKHQRKLRPPRPSGQLEADQEPLVQHPFNIHKRMDSWMGAPSNSEPDFSSRLLPSAEAE